MFTVHPLAVLPRILPLRLRSLPHTASLYALDGAGPRTLVTRFRLPHGCHHTHTTRYHTLPSPLAITIRLRVTPAILPLPTRRTTDYRFCRTFSHRIPFVVVSTFIILHSVIPRYRGGSTPPTHLRSPYVPIFAHVRYVFRLDHTFAFCYTHVFFRLIYVPGYAHGSGDLVR